MNPAHTFLPDLALDDITASPTNPRKRFDAAALDELAASIKSRGVVQPILVRPHPGGELIGYELVVGERRYRAAKLAGLTTIRALVQDLTDAEVIEIQIIENLQRADVHPIEEAEGYAKLLQQKNAVTKLNYTAEDIAEKIGKSRRYIYNRLKLMDLCPEGRNAFFDGKIDTTRARLIARIGHHDTQRTALKKITAPVSEYSQPMSTRDIERLIAREYMSSLGDAPFDIKIVDYANPAGKIIAGACGACPKRSGNAPDLFDDIANKDTCTDIKCFHAKRDAHIARETAALVEKGFTVVTGKAAAAILQSPYNSLTDLKHYVSEGAICHDDEKRRTYQKIIGTALTPIMVRRDGNSEFVRVYPRADVDALLRKKGIAADPPARAGKSSPAPRATDTGPSEADLCARGWRMLREQLASGVNEADFRLLIDLHLANTIDYGGDLEVLQLAYAPECAGQESFEITMAAIKAKIAALPPAALPRVLLDIAVDFAIDSNTHTAPVLAMLKRHGLTTKAIRKQFVEDEKVKAAAEAAAKKPTPPVSAESAAVAKKGKGKK